MVRASVILAMLPLVLFSTIWRPHQVPAPKPVNTATVTVAKAKDVRVVPLDTRTFDARWRTITDTNTPPQTIMVRTERIVQAPNSNTDVEQEDYVPLPAARHKVIIRHSPQTRRDICARHGMRKVHYGKRWRCRR